MAQLFVKSKCAICNGTGLVPSPVLGKFSGKLIPNAFTRCECNPEEMEHYHRITPDDFDYPMDWSQWRWVCQTYGKGDPGPDRPREEQQPERPQILKTTDHHHDQLEGSLVSLRDILKQHVLESTKKRKTGKY